MSLEQSMQLLSTLSIHFLLIVLFFVLGDLSRIMGRALKKKPLYLGLFGSGALVLTAQIMILLNGGSSFYAVFLDLVAVLLAVIAAFYYWNWLLKDLMRR